MIRFLARLYPIIARARGILIPAFSSHVHATRLTVGPSARLHTSMGGRISAGPDCAVESRALLHAEKGSITLGRDVFIGTGTIIVAREDITIGDDTLIAEYVTIRDQDHEMSSNTVKRSAGFRTSPISIGRNVWIGAKCSILKGVTIGDDSVIAANAVVSRDVPARTVAAGIPARVIRSL